MDPLVRTPAQHQGILLPDAAPGKVETRVLVCLAKDQPLGVGVPDVYAAVIGKIGLHAAECGQQEIIELRVRQIVVLDLSRCLFHIHAVRRVCQYQVCLLPVHQTGIYFLAGRIAADDPVLSDEPQVTRPGKDRLLQLRVDIEVILFDILVMELVEQLPDLRRVKAGLPDIEITAVSDVLQELRQEMIVPLAGDLVQRNVQGFLPGLVDVHHRAGDLGVSKILCHGQSLMAADNCHVGIDHQRIGKAEFLDGIQDLLVFPIALLELFARIIFSRFQNGNRQDFQFRCFLQFAPP